VIINVSSLDNIQQQLDVTPEGELIEPVEKTDDEVIVNIDSTPMAEKFG
jgi:hypothetical protein